MARCVIRKPIFVILDEATSSLDTRTEVAMQANMKGKQQMFFYTQYNTNSMKNFVEVEPVSLWPTIMHANTIIVMSGGGIVERGNHSELLDLKGHYFEMWKAQTSSLISEAEKRKLEKHSEM